MKTSQTSILAIVLNTVLCGACLLPQAAFCQGSLTPPGTPAPTMKTLDQIEPRTPISSAPYAINSPGSYYLTTNLSVTAGNAITIGANRVTVDLNGFTLSSTDTNNTGAGVSLLGFTGGATDITILNGHIMGGVTNGGGVYSGPGFANGISFTAASPLNARVIGVSVSGCLLDGISAATVVESCTVRTVGGYGISATSVSHSTAYLCGNTAIFADTASDCYGQCTGSGNGVQATTAINCHGVCTGSGSGLTADTANNCEGQTSSSTAAGLQATTANNCFGQNTSSGSGSGLSADTATNSKGVSSGGASGLQATYTATGCFGSSSFGNGLSAFNAANCYGTSGGPSANGLYATDVAIGCYGISTGDGTGLRAFIAEASDGSSFNVTHKYNMP